MGGMLFSGFDRKNFLEVSWFFNLELHPLFLSSIFPVIVLISILINSVLGRKKKVILLGTNTKNITKTSNKDQNCKKILYGTKFEKKTAILKDQKHNLL